MFTCKPYPTLKNYIVLNVKQNHVVIPKHASRFTHKTFIQFNSKSRGLEILQTLVDGSSTTTVEMGCLPCSAYCL